MSFFALAVLVNDEKYMEQIKFRGNYFLFSFFSYKIVTTISSSKLLLFTCGFYLSGVNSINHTCHAFGKYEARHFYNTESIRDLDLILIKVDS